MVWVGKRACKEVGSSSSSSSCKKIGAGRCPWQVRWSWLALDVALPHHAATINEVATILCRATTSKRQSPSTNHGRRFEFDGAWPTPDGGLVVGRRPKHTRSPVVFRPPWWVVVVSECGPQQTTNNARDQRRATVRANTSNRRKWHTGYFFATNNPKSDKRCSTLDINWSSRLRLRRKLIIKFTIFPR